MSRHCYNNVKTHIVVKLKFAFKCALKPDLAADHAAEAGTAAGPAAANLALQKQVAVFVADGHATAAAVTLVVGTKRAGEPGGGGAGVGIGKVNGLHWIS